MVSITELYADITAREAKKPRYFINTFFTNRINDFWNSLPRDVSAQSLQAFKYKLSHVNLQKFKSLLCYISLFGLCSMMVYCNVGGQLALLRY